MVDKRKKVTHTYRAWCVVIPFADRESAECCLENLCYVGKIENRKYTEKY